MEELKGLFGEDALTYAQLEQKLNASDTIKLANLKSNTYVDINKFAKAQSEAKDYKEKYNALFETTKDYDDVKAKYSQYVEKEENSQMFEKLKAYKIDEKFSKFVFNEVKSTVNDKKDFDTALKEYASQNPQFVSANQKSLFVKKSTTPNLENGQEQPKQENQTMNEILRSSKQ